MSRIRAVVAGGIGTVALLVSAALPASAAPSGTTTTTFTLSSGTLDIAVASNASLPGGNSGTTSVSGQIGFVTVTDSRGNILGWTTSAASTPFTGDSGTTSAAVGYSSGTVSKTGTVTVASSGAVALTTTPAPVVAGTSVVGNNTATWNPTLTVTLPPNSLAGTYTGTVTTSVA
jgi:hypothetical protein